MGTPGIKVSASPTGPEEAEVQELLLRGPAGAESSSSFSPPAASPAHASWCVNFFIGQNFYLNKAMNFSDHFLSSITEGGNGLFGSGSSLGELSPFWDR